MDILVVWLVTLLPSGVFGACLSADDYNALSMMGVRPNHMVSVPTNTNMEYQFVSPEYADVWEALLVSSLPSWLTYNSTSTGVRGTPTEVGVVPVRLDLTTRGRTTLPHTCNGSLTAVLTIHVQNVDTTTPPKGKCSGGPILENPVDHVKIQVGRPFYYSVCDTFKSSDDPDLTLTLPYGEEIVDGFWLEMDASTKLLYGLPIMADTKVTDSVTLVATDTCGQKTRDAVHLDIQPLPEITYNIILELTPLTGSVVHEGSLLVYLASRLDAWFEDMNAHVFVVDIEWHVDGLTLQFTLSDSQHSTCSKPYLRKIVDKMKRPTFSCLIAPMFSVHNVSVNFTNSCVDTYIHPFTSEYSMSKIKATLDHWLEIVVPCAAFIVVVTVVLLVLMVCNSQYPRRRKRYVLKSEVPTYLEDRKPIIFPDETRTKDSSLEPRSPMLLPSNGEVDPSPWQQNEESGSQPLLMATPNRSGPTPPEYLLDEMGVPPPYRLPPPYHSTHPTW